MSVFALNRNKITAYLCVDDFMKDSVAARALATAFELGLIDYFDQSPPAFFDDLNKRFKADARGLGLLIDLLKSNRVVEEKQGQLSLDLMHEDDRRNIEEMLPEWIGHKRGWTNLLIRWRHKEGGWRFLEGNAG